MTDFTPAEYRALVEYQNALEALYAEIAGGRITPNVTARDMADAIKLRYDRAIEPPRRTEYDDSRLGEELL